MKLLEFDIRLNSLRPFRANTPPPATFKHPLHSRLSHSHGR